MIDSDFAVKEQIEWAKRITLFNADRGNCEMKRRIGRFEDVLFWIIPLHPFVLHPSGENRFEPPITHLLVSDFYENLIFKYK